MRMQLRRFFPSSGEHFYEQPHNCTASSTLQKRPLHKAAHPGEAKIVRGTLDYTFRVV